VNKSLRYILKGTGIVLGLLLAFWLIVLIYVSANKKEIIARVTTELNDRMDATATIGDLDPSFFQTFPFLSLRLKDISLRDSMWHQHHHDFLKAEKLFLRVNPFSLFSATPQINKIIVEKGSIYLFTDTSNYTNAYIMNAKKKKTRKGFKPPFNGIELKEVRLSFINPHQGKLFDFNIKKLVCDVDSEDSTTVLAIKADMHVHNLAFNTDRGSFLQEKRVEGKFKVTLAEQQIALQKIKLKIDEQPFEVSAIFEIGADPKFTLSIATINANYGTLTSMLTDRLQKKLDTFGVSNKLDASATLTGSLLPKTNPLIDVKWQVRNSDLKTPAGTFTNCSLDGAYTNQADSSLPRHDSNSVIAVNAFKGEYETIPISASKILISELRQPRIAFDLHTSVLLKSLNEMTGIESFDFGKGTAEVNINYSGPLMSEDTTQTLISGAVDISDGEFTYLPRNLAMSDCKGSLIFDKSAVYIKDLKAKTKRSDFLIGGKIDNFLSALDLGKEDMVIDLDIASSRLDLSDFTQNLQKRKQVSKQKTGARFMKIANRIDKLIEQSGMRINLAAKNVQYKKFTATNAKAALALVRDEWKLENVSLNHADGKVVIDGRVKTDGNENPFTIRGKMDNIDISKVFYAFNNFSFDGLSDKNIDGQLTADFDISAVINSKAEIVPFTTRGFISISLKNGALKNFEPMQKISNSVVKNRDMTDIRFAELKDHLDINGTSIKINSMEIQSTVLSMFIEGTYDLKTGPDLSILVPLSNLKKRGADFELVNKGTESKKGISVHLRAKYGDDGKVKVSWDPFKKARKSKDKKPVDVE
jgi:AsmA-like protein